MELVDEDSFRGALGGTAGLGVAEPDPAAVDQLADGWLCSAECSGGLGVRLPENISQHEGGPLQGRQGVSKRTASAVDTSRCWSGFA